MRRVYLVRHASPLVTPAEPARDWPLSPDGVDEARQLAQIAAGWGIAAAYSSSEAKARATALAIVGDAGPPVHVVDAFDELTIDAYIDNADRFNEAVQAVLAGRDWPGAETAEHAALRFERGLGLIAGGPFPAAVVSHGRILTAYISRAFAVDDPYAYWRRIPMPGWTAIDLDAVGGEAPTFSGLATDG